MVELIQRYVKILILFVLAWVLIWAFNNTGCRKIEGSEMAPGMKKDEFKIVLVQKRKPEDLKHDDVVVVEYHRTDGLPQTSFAGRIFGKPGDLIWVERKFVSPQILAEGVEARRERPSKEEEARFLPIVVPRDSYFVACDNKQEYTVYDSRGIGPVGVWAIQGKVKN